MESRDPKGAVRQYCRL